MKPWQAIVCAVLLLSALAYLCYAPSCTDTTSANAGPSVMPQPAKTTIGSTTLTFASDPWVPYAGKAGATREGYIVDILRKIYEPLGYRVRFVNMPWSRCLRDTRDGQITGLAGADFDEVPDFVFPTETIGATRPTFFVAATSTWKFAGYASLSNIVLGVIQDYTYTAELDAYVRRNRESGRVFAAGGELPLKGLMDAMQEGRLHVFVENAPVVWNSLAGIRVPTNAVREAGTPGPGVRLFVPFSPAVPRSPEYAGIFDRRLAELRASGELQKILQVYGMEDWIPAVREIERIGHTGTVKAPPAKPQP